MLSWFDTSEVDRFADTLVAELARRTPPASLAADGRKSDARFHRMTEVLSQRVRQFAESQRPNVFKRARLGNRVKWALKDAGYPDPFVDAFTYEVVTLVTTAGKSSR